LGFPAEQYPPVENHEEEKVKRPKDMHPVVVYFVPALQDFADAREEPC
jgi:hypothetical protein